jgi:aryl-alcohol dehydrogenase-like predicted oxidoreductase
VAQLAVAWVLAQGAAQHDVVAIVGAGRPERIADNLAAARLQLTDADLADIARAVPPSAVAGDRYAASLMAMLDSAQ